MHLTPRNLGLATAAVLAGFTLFGLLTSLDLVPTATAGGATSPPAPPSASPSASATSPAPEPTPVATQPTSPAPRPSATWSLPAPAGATSRAVPSPSPSPSVSQPRKAPTRAAPTGTPAARPRATRNPAPAPGRRFTGQADASRAVARPAVKRALVTGSWSAPALHAGSNTITVPHLTSGANVTVTVGCSPSAGCALAGSTLDIAEGTRVTVTWSAPSRPGFTAWTVSRAL